PDEHDDNRRHQQDAVVDGEQEPRADDGHQRLREVEGDVAGGSGPALQLVGGGALTQRHERDDDERDADAHDGHAHAYEPHPRGEQGHDAEGQEDETEGGGASLPEPRDDETGQQSADDGAGALQRHQQPEGGGVDPEGVEDGEHDDVEEPGGAEGDPDRD